MSNKAKNSKESIICDAKELMKLYDSPPCMVVNFWAAIYVPIVYT